MSELPIAMKHASLAQTRHCHPEEQELNELKASVEQSLCTPRHVALIMDGNGRWASERGLKRSSGHRAGTKNMLSIVRTCIDLNIHYLTVYIFSTENWHRPASEVTCMMQLVSEFIERELETIHAWSVHLRHLGRLEGINEKLKYQVQYALTLTENNTGMTLAVALNYGSRADIVDAVRRLIANGTPADAINEQTIAAHLSTHDMPDPDMVIRTSGEQRLSNFLLWESAHSECLVIPVFWPEFKPLHLYKAMKIYYHRYTKIYAHEQA